MVLVQMSPISAPAWLVVKLSVLIKRGQKWASGSSGQAGISKKVPSDLKPDIDDPS